MLPAGFLPSCCFAQACFFMLVIIQSPTYRSSHRISLHSICFCFEALVCPKGQTHTAVYQHDHVALPKRYACSDAMIASVLLGTSFAAGQALPFNMSGSCIAAACATTRLWQPFSIYAEASAHVAMIKASCVKAVGMCRCTTLGRFLSVSASSWLGWWRHCFEIY